MEFSVSADYHFMKLLTIFSMIALQDVRKSFGIHLRSLNWIFQGDTRITFEGLTHSREKLG